MVAQGRGKASSGERVLLSFTGFHDPFASVAVAGNEQEGPVLSVARLRSFDRVVLFSTPGTIQNTAATVKALQDRHPTLKVESCDFTFADPTDYFSILAALRACFKRIVDSTKDASYFIATASGTPQMHACWLLLAASGEIPARLLHAKNVKFVTSDAAAITEIDLTRPEFPVVRSNPLHTFETEDGAADESVAVIADLGIVGDHPETTASLQKAINLAPYDIPVLIAGESGTGKEKVAQLIHRMSARKAGPFVPVNCAGIPSQLAESMLFGHVKGAFTGATDNQMGRFEQAHGGTLFLDELAELSPDNQAKLLRALQEKLIDPVGAAKSKKVDCRIITATNVDLNKAVKEGRFREDLYYRVVAASVELPPLRARRSDISKLAQHFLDELNRKYKKSRVFTPDALAVMQSYDWPGNVRQLQNEVQNAAIQAVGGKIEPKHLSLRGASADRVLDDLPEPREGFSLDEFLAKVRTRMYDRAMEISGGNASKAARLLDLTPQAVQKFLKGRS